MGVRFNQFRVATRRGILNAVYHARAESAQAGEPVPGLFTERKLLAVLLTAFGPGAGNDHLVLRATPQELADAPGLGIDNWPGLRRTDWGAELFWQAPTAPNEGRRPAAEKHD
jgi:hypothetical protein